MSNETGFNIIPTNSQGVCQQCGNQGYLYKAVSNAGGQMNERYICYNCALNGSAGASGAPVYTPDNKPEKDYKKIIIISAAVILLLILVVLGAIFVPKLLEKKNAASDIQLEGTYYCNENNGYIIFKDEENAVIFNSFGFADATVKYRLTDDEIVFIYDNTKMKKPFEYKDEIVYIDGGAYIKSEPETTTEPFTEFTFTMPETDTETTTESTTETTVFTTIATTRVTTTTKKQTTAATTTTKKATTNPASTSATTTTVKETTSEKATISTTKSGTTTETIPSPSSQPSSVNNSTSASVPDDVASSINNMPNITEQQLYAEIDKRYSAEDATKIKRMANLMLKDSLTTSEKKELVGYMDDSGAMDSIKGVDSSTMINYIRMLPKDIKLKAIYSVVTDS